MSTIKKNKLSLNKILSVVFLFYIFYLPRITDLLFNILSQYVIIILCFVLAIFRLDNIFKENTNASISKKALVEWSIKIIFLSAYTALIALFNNYNSRFFQYIYIILWILTLYWFKKIVLDKYFSNKEILEIILWFGVIQGIICIIMLISPSAKEIANSLCFLNEKRNIFRMEKRIFGISNDYTFFTPCYHGFLSSLCILYSIIENKKFILAFPFIFLATFLNNRTGIIICAINIFVICLFILFDKEINPHIKINVLKVFFSIIVFLSVILILIKTFNPKNFMYTINGIFSAREWVDEQDSQWYFPEGISFVFGTGEVQAGVSRRKMGLSMDLISDFGYVNDMFIGGIVYCIGLYISNFRFVLTMHKKKIFHGKMLYFDIIMIITLLISNYKGQSMKSGFLITALFFIKLVLLDYIDERDNKNEKINLPDDNLQREQRFSENRC